MVVTSVLRTDRLYHQEMLPVLISVKGWVDPKAIVRSEEFYANKRIPMTPAGIEPATFQFVAQHVNHCNTARNFVIICVKFNTGDPQIILLSSGKLTENRPRKNVCYGLLLLIVIMTRVGYTILYWMVHYLDMNRFSLRSEIYAHLGTFVQSLEAPVSFGITLHLSICQHVSVQHPVDWWPCNFILGGFLNIWRGNPNWVTMRPKNQALEMKT